MDLGSEVYSRWKPQLDRIRKELMLRLESSFLAPLDHAHFYRLSGLADEPFQDLEAWDTKFTYDPLTMDGRSIRILRLHPGEPADPIQCTIHPATLPNVSGKYEALSYTWGPKTPRRIIFVNHKLLLIRRNLWDFLHALRLVDAAIDLWADAICIDQSNALEKNHQVQQMSLIYTSCCRVRIWLGIASVSLAQLLELSKQRPLLRDLFGGIHSGDSDLIDILEVGLKDLLELGYWRRLWIVQEVILPPEVFVHCGLIRLAWDELIDVVMWANESLLSSYRWDGLRPEDYDTMIVLNLHYQRQGVSRRNLVDLLKAYGKCECLDIRDRIYGLLGLWGGDEAANGYPEPRIIVDYTASLQTLFHNVMAAHKPQFAEDLAQELFIALELHSIPQMPPQFRPATKVAMKAAECGSLVAKGKFLKWNLHPLLHIAVHSLRDQHVNEGEILYTLSLPAFNAVSGRSSLLLVLKEPWRSCSGPRSSTGTPPDNLARPSRQQRQIRNNGDSHTSKTQVLYKLSGVALAWQPRSSCVLDTLRHLALELQDSEVWRDASIFGYGPMTVAIPFQAIAAIFDTLGFPNLKPSSTQDFLANLNKRAASAGQGGYGTGGWPDNGKDDDGSNCNASSLIDQKPHNFVHCIIGTF